MGFQGLAGAGAVALCALLALAPRRALACSVPVPPPVPTDPAKVGLDRVPPRILDAEVSDIEGAEPSAACTKPPAVILNVVAEDDQTPRERLRYRLEDVRNGYWVYDEPVGWLWPYTYEAEPVRLHYRLVAVDEAGNQSAPFEVSYGETDEQGCRLVEPAPGRVLGWGWLPVALSFWLRRRRR